MFTNPQLDILSNSGSFTVAEQKTNDRYIWFIRDAYAYRLYKKDLLLDTSKFVHRTWTIDSILGYEPPEVITAKALQSFGLHEVKQCGEYKAAGSSVTECIFSTPKDCADGTFEVHINKTYIKKFPASSHFFTASPLKPVVVTQDTTENIMGLILPIRSSLTKK